MALEESAQRHTQRTGLVWCYFVKGGIGGELGWCGTGPRIGLVENWAGVVLGQGWESWRTGLLWCWTKAGDCGDLGLHGGCAPVCGRCSVNVCL